MLLLQLLLLLFLLLLLLQLLFLLQLLLLFLLDVVVVVVVTAVVVAVERVLYKYIDIFFLVSFVFFLLQTDTRVLNYAPGPMDTEMCDDILKKSDSESLKKMFVQMKEEVGNLSDLKPERFDDHCHLYSVVFVSITILKNRNSASFRFLPI
jgi:hypothetical protein